VSEHATSNLDIGGSAFHGHNAGERVQSQAEPRQSARLLRRAAAVNRDAGGVWRRLSPGARVARDGASCAPDVAPHLLLIKDSRCSSRFDYT